MSYEEPILYQKLGKLFPLLGSSNDGEALSAARAIVRVLAGHGLTLHDLVGTARSARRAAWWNEWRQEARAPAEQRWEQEHPIVHQITALHTKAGTRITNDELDVIVLAMECAHLEARMSADLELRWAELLLKYGVGQ